MAASQRHTHRASSSASTLAGDAEDTVHSSPPSVTHSHHTILQHHRSAPSSHVSSPHGPHTIDADTHWPPTYPRGGPLIGLQHGIPQHQQHHGHHGQYMPHVTASGSHSMMPSGPPAFAPSYVQAYPAAGHIPVPVRYPPSHGPPLGVFPAASHSAFDEEEPPSPTLQVSRHHAHLTPATPSSYFGATAAADTPRGGQQGAAASKATGRKTASKAKASKTAAAAVDQNAARAASPSKKTPRDPKRRASHSQIERRRREKINDRLITLRNIIPACVKEMEDRAKALIEEEEDIRRIRAGLMPSTSFPNRRVKRKRLRRKVEASNKAKDADKEGDLGMHKLEVLTHTIDYIYQLHARIEELETGKRPARIRRAEDNEDDLMEDVQDEAGVSNSRAPRATVKEEQNDESTALGTDSKASHDHGDQGDEDDDEDSEADELEDEGDEDDNNNNNDDDDDDMDIDLSAPPLKRRNSSMKEAKSITVQRRGSLGGLSAASETSSEVSVGPSGHSPYHELSPMFPPTRTASSSLSSLTSPFMSLSATSPIFMNGKQSSSSQGPVAWTKLTLPPNAFSAQEASDALRGSSSSADSAPGHATRSKRQHGSLSAVRGGTDEETPSAEQKFGQDSAITTTTGEDRSAAELLLAFSGSPEDALRPVGAKVSAVPRGRIARRSTTSSQAMSRGSIPAFSTPQVRPAGGSGHSSQHTQGTASPHKIPVSAGRHRVPGSAPGGSTATPTGREGLPSPPPLELDAQGR